MARKPFPPKKKGMSEAQDDLLDRKQGIKENSPRDARVDRSRGLPADKPKAPAKKKPFGK